MGTVLFHAATEAAYQHDSYYLAAEFPQPTHAIHVII